MEIHIVAGTEDLFATVFDNRAKMLHSYKDKIRAGSSVLSEMQFEHNKWLESFKQMCINYAHGMGCYNDVILADFKRVVGKYVYKSQIPKEGILIVRYPITSSLEGMEVFLPILRTW